MKKAQDGVQAAIQKQKEKRAAIQASSDARKEKEMAKRRAKGLPASPPKKRVTEAPAKGGDIRETMSRLQGKSFGPSKSSSKASIKGPVGTAKRKVARTAAATISAPKMKMSSEISRPSNMRGVSASKPKVEQLSGTKAQIAKLTDDIKKGKGSTESNQAKIKALREKERMAANKSMRKQKRAAVKAVRKYYKK